MELRGTSRRVALALALTTAYFIAGKLGLSIRLAHGSATPVWAPTGISLAALMLFGRELWPGIALGAFLVNVTTRVPIAFSLAAAVGNTAAVVVACTMLDTRRVPLLQRIPEVVRLVAASLLAPMLSATIGTGTLWLTHVVPWRDVAFTWWIWWLGDSLGFLIVTPLLLAWARPAIATREPRGGEAVVLGALLVAVGLAVFSSRSGGPAGHPLAYAVVPFVMWAALRFGPRGATLATVAVAGISLASIVQGYGPLNRPAQAEVLLQWQVFCAVIGITGLILAAAADVRDRAEASLRFLAEAGEVLASSLDIQRTLGTVAELASRSLADWVAVDLLEANGELARVKVTHRDPAKLAAAEALGRRYPPAPDARTGTRTVLASGRAVCADVTDARLRQLARDDEHLRLLLDLGLRSYMLVPIPIRAKTVGVISFITAESRRHYDDADLKLAQELARRTGTAIENARLYGESVEAEQAERDRAGGLEQQVRARVRQLQEQNEQMLAFSYSVSHDLRAPVRAIGGYVEALTEDLRGRIGEHDLDYLERIREATRRMDALIQGLLAYSRLGNEQLALELIPLARIVHDALAPLEPILQERRAQVWVQLADDLPMVLGHAVTLVQAIHNLVLNAATFVPAGRDPEITVRAEPRDGHLRLWIEDNGIGIDPEHHQRIFNPFERLHSARDYPGTGIGLAMVKRAVERAGGRVGVESREGAGSRFWIELPIDPGGTRTTSVDGARRAALPHPGLPSELAPGSEQRT